MAFELILDLWNKWSIRNFVVLSLLLQLFLILFAPLRKKVANHRIVFLLRLAYLMADWVATFTIGLIARNQGNSSTLATEVDGALLAFWASFLLLHLGGPDTITVFSLEDNSLWEWHLLSLIFQVGVAIYLLVHIYSNDKLLVIPTILVFLVGVIKNVERTLALKHSSLQRLMESMLSNHFLCDKKESNMSAEESNPRGETYICEEEANIEEIIVVKHAYYFFQIFKVFIKDYMFERHERKTSQDYFFNVSAMDAFRVISVELNFMYELLHTKALIIHSRRSYIFRFVAFTDLVLAFVLFNRLKKHRLPELDVGITYFLIFGGMALDVIALFRLIFSDWTVAGIKCFKLSKLDSFLHKLAYALYVSRKPQYAICEAEPNTNAMYEVLDTPFIFRRWSESIFACNLLSEFLKESPRKMYKHDQSWGTIALSNICCYPLHMAEKIISKLDQASETIFGLCCPRGKLMIANTKYVSENPFIKDLWIFIFKEIKRKSKNVKTQTDVKKIFEARGDMFLQDLIKESSYFAALVTETNYDDSIISWHLATEIWYNKEKPTIKNKEREISKILSDYMLYLLLNQHNVVSAVAGVAQITSAELLVELRDHISGATKDLEELCKKIYNFPSNDFHSVSALEESYRLAKIMEGLGEMKWKVMSGVWVEMLSYAASHIKGEAHVQVLSQGGELLTFVWMLMAHFGCLYKHGWGICYSRRSILPL